MYRIENFADNDDVAIAAQKGPFSVIEYKRDLSCSPINAQLAYFCSKMNVRQKVISCNLAKGNVVLQPGEMQWMAGNVESTTGIKGVGDLIGKAFRANVTKESAIKPEYKGDGTLVLEPTWSHILLVDVGEWSGGIVLDDGLFKACEATLKHTLTARSNLSSAVAGNQGLFNLSLEGEGVVCLESAFPEKELVLVDLQDDVLKIDGNLAIAWSKSLNFTVERAGKSLAGSAASGEGLVNVYRGTGKVWMAPFAK